MGKHKIPMEKIEKKNARQTCFSKRRKGLFRKAGDLCSLGHEIAIVVFSNVGNAYTFAHPSVESVTRRFNQEHNPDHREPELTTRPGPEDVKEEAADIESNHVDSEHRQVVVDDQRSNTRATMITREELVRSDKFWWNKPVDDSLGVEELIDLERATAELRQKVLDRANFLLGTEPLSLGSLYTDK